MSKVEFNENLDNTSQDWAHWLKSNQDYKLINP